MRWCGKKNGRAGQVTDVNIIQCMLTECWITKATNTHSQYVTLIAFPLRQWLHECASVVHTYIHCLSWYCFHDQEWKKEKALCIPKLCQQELLFMSWPLTICPFCAYWFSVLYHWQSISNERLMFYKITVWCITETDVSVGLTHQETDNTSVIAWYCGCSSWWMVLNEVYVGCTKSIGPLVGKNTIIYFDVWNPNPLQSSLLGNANTSSSGPAIAGNISGKLLVESCTAGLSRSA